MSLEDGAKVESWEKKEAEPMQVIRVTMTLFCTHGRVSGPSSLLDLEVMAPRGYSVPCQF